MTNEQASRASASAAVLAVPADPPLGDLRFRALMGAAQWASLAPAIRHRFSKRLADSRSAVYAGRITETRMTRLGWLLAQAARLFGAPLPLSREAGVPATVTVTEDPATGGQFWTRIYGRRRGFPQVIHSAKRFQGPTGLEEYLGHGFGMALTVEGAGDTLTFRSAHYFVQLFGRRLRLARWLGPGATTVSHIDRGDGRFAFILELRHPRLGLLIRQAGEFRDVVDHDDHRELDSPVSSAFHPLPNPSPAQAGEGLSHPTRIDKAPLPRAVVRQCPQTSHGGGVGEGVSSVCEYPMGVKGMRHESVANVALTVLLVGAAGSFGRLLAEGLAAEPGIRLILAGRNRASLDRLRARLGGTPRVCVLDRGRVTASDLRTLGAAVVIDAAGPFQDSRTALIEAAIDSGCHYVDLADGRDFVANIHRFGAAAQRARVAVLSGASSTPALSHAVLDALTEGWRRIDTLSVAICPGNRAPRGLSVVRAILTWAGRPVPVFRNGAWTTPPGWSGTRKIDIPGLGLRLAALCETPDLDLLVTRYQPRVSAEFLAGLELPVLHHGLALATWPVRRGWLRSLAPLARPLRALAALLRPFGSDRGGMVVEATGRDADDRPVRARWSLVAGAGKGAYVPTLAALALARRIRDGRLGFRGASPCTGILTPADFAGDFARLGMTTAMEVRAERSRHDVAIDAT